MANTLYTIGYSGYLIDDFIAALRQRDISVVIDVRSSPYSQYYKDYNRENLIKILRQNGIYYKNYAQEFGARQENPKYIAPEGYLDFELFTKSDAFISGRNKIERAMAENYTIALLCAEKDPIICHRTIMISRAFHDKNHNVAHITPDGDIAHADIETRLLDTYFPTRDQIGFFDDGDKLLQAYRKQNAKIGFYIEEDSDDDIHDGFYAKNRAAVL